MLILKDRRDDGLMASGPHRSRGNQIQDMQEKFKNADIADISTSNIKKGKDCNNSMHFKKRSKIYYQFYMLKKT